MGVSKTNIQNRHKHINKNINKINERICKNVCVYLTGQVVTPRALCVAYNKIIYKRAVYIK